jgi:hypothetical protein
LNIFYLSPDPATAAQAQCDKHVVKMVLETAQMLSAVIHRHGIKDDAAYKPTHKHHPCTLWAGESRDNFLWLVEHGRALGAEYTRRYSKTHKSLRVIEALAHHADALPDIGPTPPAQAMPDEYRVPGDAVAAYRAYYTEGKSRTIKMTWRSPSVPPSWFTPCED